MPPVDPCFSSQRLRPGTAGAFERAVREACEVVSGVFVPSAAPIDVHTAGPSLVRRVSLDSSRRPGSPASPDHLGGAAKLILTVPDHLVPAFLSNLDDDMAAASPGQAHETAGAGQPAAEEVGYYTQIAAQMHGAASVREQETFAAQGFGAVALKPGMSRLVTPASLRSGIEFGELHGDPFNMYEFVLRFPVDKHHLCVWTSQRHGKVRLLLASGDTGRITHSNSLSAGECMSQIFGIERASDYDARDGAVILRIQGIEAYFVGVRLYLKAI
jgi:hypothetical protein